MPGTLDGSVFEGLERLCDRPDAGHIISAPANAGLERIEARFTGDAFEPHRHDTYAIGVTLHGIQTFQYRGETRYSTAGQLIVLHPDELHDGGAATEEGLRYRMLYVEPSLLRRALDEDGAPLPFVADPVVDDEGMFAALRTVLGDLEHELEDLSVDDLLGEIGRGLTRNARQTLRPLQNSALRQARAAKEYLEENLTTIVRSEELERVSGIDRFELSRHFRAVYATSPYRFHLMRRLHRGRAMIEAGMPIAEIAAATAFADQAHFSRHFKKAFGLTPGRWQAMTEGSRREEA